MGRLLMGVSTASLLVLACACSGGHDGVGDAGASSGGSGGAGTGGAASGGAASGGAASGGAASGGAASGGVSAEGSGGASLHPCAVIDGRLSYGPIGERQALPVTAADELFGVPTSAGYGLVWRSSYDSEAPNPNLFVMNVDAAFQETAPQELLAENTASALDVVPVPGGFVAATCSPESEPGWVHLDEDLDQLPSSILVPDASCDRRAPGLVWTGERYLTPIVDSRGLLVASLDEQGVPVGEELVSTAALTPSIARFSQNGERVLFVYNEEGGGRGFSVVLDRTGAALEEVGPLGQEDSRVSHVAVTPRGDGWLVASDSSRTNDTGLLMTTIAGDGLVGPESRLTTNYVSSVRSRSSAYGGSLVVGQAYTGGQFGADVRFTYLVDHSGRVVYSGEHDDPNFIPVGLIDDPLRDLVVEKPTEGAESSTLTVQEYGCLD